MAKKRSRPSGGRWAALQIQKEREKRGNQCEYFFPDNNGGKRCGETLDLHFAHVRDSPIRTNYRGFDGRGSWVRLKDIRGFPRSYKLLCKDHHNEFDSGELRIDGMQSPSYLEGLTR